MSTDSLGFLKELEEVIGQRAGADASESYTARLFDRGVDYVAQKVGEEAVELAIAAVRTDRTKTISEAADLLYHLLVLLRIQGLNLGAVVAELESRHR